MLIGYARVSTADQTLALQQDALHKAGCDKIFTDTAPGLTHEKPEAERDEMLQNRTSPPAPREASAAKPADVFAEWAQLPMRSHAVAPVEAQG